jgi:competence protein ComEA
MKDILIKKKAFLVILTGEFVISFLLGFLAHMYLLPLAPYIKHRVANEAVYIIEDSCSESPREDIAEKTKKENSTCPIRVDLSGALNNSGVYCLKEDELLIDAIEKAGGFSKDVGLKFVSRKINLASPLVNNQKIYIPYEDDLICTLQTFQSHTKEVEHLPDQNIVQNVPGDSEGSKKDVGENKDETEDDTGTEEGNCININTGSKEDLVSLNGIGESTAQKIIDARPFETIEDILNVSGIGEATFDKFKDNICL